MDEFPKTNKKAKEIVKRLFEKNLNIYYELRNKWDSKNRCFSDEKELMGACGDRAVVILDARNSIKTSIKDAIKFNGNRRPVYDAFQLFSGCSFNRSFPISDIIQL